MPTKFVTTTVIPQKRTAITIGEALVTRAVTLAGATLAQPARTRAGTKFGGQEIRFASNVAQENTRTNMGRALAKAVPRENTRIQMGGTLVQHAARVTEPTATLRPRNASCAPLGSIPPSTMPTLPANPAQTGRSFNPRLQAFARIATQGRTSTAPQQAQSLNA
jgi:hypothetical protein